MKVFIRALLSTPVSLRTHRSTELSDCATPYGALTEEEKSSEEIKPTEVQ